MNRTELVAAMAEKSQLSKKDAESALKAFIDVVSEEMQKGEKIQLVGFGTFEVSERAAREGRNPQTGETMTIAASKSKVQSRKSFKRFSKRISNLFILGKESCCISGCDSFFSFAYRK